MVKLMQFVSDPDPTQYTKFDFLPGILILLTVFLIIFFSLKLRGYSTTATFAACSIANFILSILIYPLGIVSGQILVVAIVLLPLSAVLLWFTGETM